MLRLMWVPKKYKNFSFREVAEEAERILQQTKEQQKINQKFYADLLVLENYIANLSEEEARYNISVIVSALEHQFSELNEES